MQLPWVIDSVVKTLGSLDQFLTVLPSLGDPEPTSPVIEIVAVRWRIAVVAQPAGMRRHSVFIVPPDWRVSASIAVYC